MVIDIIKSSQALRFLYSHAEESIIGTPIPHYFIMITKKTPIDRDI